MVQVILNLDKVINKHKDGSGALLKVLRDIQEHYGWLPVEALQQVSRGLGLSPTKVYRAAIFGNGFRVIPTEDAPATTDTCIVTLVKYYLDFLQHDLCGKCISCCEGVRQMHNIVAGIDEGEAGEGDIELLKEVAEFVAKTADCVQGVIVADLILTALSDFRDHFEAHLNGECTVGVRKLLAGKV